MLLNMASKVFCIVILKRIKIALDEKLPEEQAGFRASRSCTDEIATLRIIVKQSIEWQSSLYINFKISKRPSIVSAGRFCGGCCGTTGCLKRLSPSSELSMKVFPHRWYIMDRGPNH